MADIDRMSRRVPHLAKVAPSIQTYHMEDVHRAGGVMGILGELDRAGLLHTDVPTVYAPTLKAALDTWDIARAPSAEVREFYRAGPAGIPPRSPSARPPAGRAWMPTASAAASVPSRTPTAATAASRCSTATWR